MKKNPKLQRPRKTHERRPVIFLAMEGTRTEPQYFDAIHSFGKLKSFHFQPVQKGGNPDALLKKIRKMESLMEEHDFAWLVCDRDRESWTEEALNSILEWSDSDARNGFLFSNPSFELWLLLHFEDWPPRLNQSRIEELLSRRISNYKKQIPSGTITLQRVKKAIQRAAGHPHRAFQLMNQSGTTVGEILKEFFD